MGDYDWLISRNNDLEADLYNKAIRIRDLEEEQLIGVEDYVLTNINLDGYYTIRLKDNKEYKIYKEGKRDYILKDDKKIYLSNEVRKAVLSNIREYEKYGI